MTHGDPQRQELERLAVSTLVLPLVLYALAGVAFVGTRAGFWSVGAQSGLPSLEVFTRVLLAVAGVHLLVSGGVGWRLLRQAERATMPLEAARCAFAAAMVTAAAGLSTTLMGVVAALVTRTPSRVTPYFALTLAFFFVVWHIVGRGRRLIDAVRSHRAQRG